MSLRGKLTIDLDAIIANWRSLAALTGPDCESSAVVKANGYGLGTAEVGKALAGIGVRTFFVAVPIEGETLRAAIGPEPLIYILNGYGSDALELYKKHDLRPVLNSADQAQAWFTDRPGAPSAVQLDTGMNRVGMEAAEFASLGALPDSVKLVMSHAGCADEPAHRLNAIQLAEFLRLTEGIERPRSLAGTAAVLLGTDWHFDLTRPGIGLYGGFDFPGAKPVVRLEIPIIQIRDVMKGEVIGYSATWTAKRPSRIATLAIGYADGLIRACSNHGRAFINGQPANFAGRVSMDLTTLDVTDIPCAPDDMVELLGPNQGVIELAEAGGTIGHEILTSLGTRYHWEYQGD